MAIVGGGGGGGARGFCLNTVPLSLSGNVCSVALAFLMFSFILNMPRRLFLFLSGASKMSLMRAWTMSLQSRGSAAILSSNGNSSRSRSSLDEPPLRVL